MSAILDPTAFPEPAPLTLLDLVTAVTEVADGERETVEIVSLLLASGRVRLQGQFRETHLHLPH